MDGREDEVVLVQAGRAGVVGARARRVEDELGDEALQARRPCGGADQLLEIDQARLRIRLGAAQ
jgi:hypothetical protein